MKKYYLSEEEKNRAINLYESGMSMAAVGDELGRGTSTVAVIIKSAGLSRSRFDRDYTMSDDHKEKLRQAKLKNPTRYWKGKKRSKKTRKAISNAHKGKPLSDKHKKKLSKALKGRHVSDETRRKLSKAHKGKNAPNWKGGVSKKHKRIRAGVDFKMWRESVYERDDFTCRACNERGGYLHPHHIENFYNNKDKRFDVDNGITLCKMCHTQFHKEYGFKDNNHDQINEFVQ